jgi:DNA-binding CsgD family transcriptional regulator/PAS domain-containing protein
MLRESAVKPSFQTLQHLIQQGVLEDPPWMSLAREMRAVFRANNVEIFFHRNDGEAINLTAAVDSECRPPDHMQRYRDNFRKVDPFPYFAMESGRVYRLAELLHDLDSNVFYQEFMRPVGLEEMIMFYVEEEGGYRGWVSIARRSEAGTFDAEEMAICTDIAGQLRSALTVFAQLKRLEMEREIYANALRRLHMGYLLLDQRGQLLRMDDEAADLLSRHRELFLNRKRLHIRQAEKDRELQSIIAEGLASTDRSFSRAMNVPGQHYIGLLISSVPASPIYASDVDPHLVIYINEPAVRDIAPQARIAELFDLSATEAALVVELVRGRTLQEAAASIHITEQTARNYSKRIFSKTGTHRQAELVRLILTSVALVA